MARKQTSRQIALHYSIVRLVAAGLALLPLSLAVALGRFIGFLLYTFDQRHRRRCIDAIRCSLQVEETEADRMTRGMYRHLGTMLAEFPRLPRIRAKNVDAHMDWNDTLPMVNELSQKGKGIIFFTGHIGNWEATGACSALKGILYGSVARPLDNPRINSWVRQVRESAGQEIWDKRGAMRQALRCLKKGQNFGILNDQNGGEDGEFVTFFGQCASTVAAAADLAIRTGAPLVPSAALRVAPMRFQFHAGEPVWPDPQAKDPIAERRRLLEACNRGLEAIIRKQPEQWLWLHARWKTQPKKKIRD